MQVFSFCRHRGLNIEILGTQRTFLNSNSKALWGRGEQREREGRRKEGRRRDGRKDGERNFPVTRIDTN